MSILEFSNRFFFQWFFVRLTRCKQRVVDEIDMTHVSFLPNGNHGIGGYIVKAHTEEWYSFQGWIVPMSGWGTDFKYFGKTNWFKKMTKNKIA